MKDSGTGYCPHRLPRFMEAHAPGGTLVFLELLRSEEPLGPLDELLVEPRVAASLPPPHREEAAFPVDEDERVGGSGLAELKSRGVAAVLLAKADQRGPANEDGAADHDSTANYSISRVRTPLNDPLGAVIVNDKLSVPPAGMVSGTFAPEMLNPEVVALTVVIVQEKRIFPFKIWRVY